ncbi:MAG: hypothetical protein LBK42_12775 [Propionibacteriaceae bacterium]|jgi:apolipoprotein N-acyltransferase|nr:hypothetical protein [Propionibacteriaceae bacterium]
MSSPVRTRRLVSAVSALAAGVAVGLAFPPTGWWPLMPLGLAVFGWLTAVRRPRLRAGLVLGYLFGLGFFTTLIRWLLVVDEVWGATFPLAALMAAWFALLGVALTWLGRFPGWPLFAAAAVVAVEFVDSRWPLGGFPWGRLAYAAADTPIDGWFPLISASGVSWLIAATSFMLPWAAQALVAAKRQGRLSLALLDPDRTAPATTTTATGPTAPVSAAVTTAPPPTAPAPAAKPRPEVAPGTPVELPVALQDLIQPLALLSIAARAVATWVVLGLVGLGGWTGDQYVPAAADDSVVVGVIQGNAPGTGLTSLGPARTTTYNSLAETIALMAQVAVGQAERPDFVLWPESSTDLDPTTDQRTAALLDAAVDLARAPLFLGGLIGLGEDSRHTTAIWWDHGPQAVYDKRNLVPFGEWVPARSLLEPLFPQLELVGRQTVPGSGVGVVSGQLRDGRIIAVGVLICFEVGYDDTADDLILGDATTPGAQLVVVQTNNSSLTGSGQMAQQDAITQIRAMESRRDIAVATTNSLAGWITPEGDHAWQAELGRSAAASLRLPLRSGATLAVAHRRTIEICLVAGPALILGLVWIRQRRRAATMGAVSQEGARP